MKCIHILINNFITINTTYASITAHIMPLSVETFLLLKSKILTNDYKWNRHYDVLIIIKYTSCIAIRLPLWYYTCLMVARQYTVKA